MIKNSKEVMREFNLAMKHFRNAIKMGKKNVIVGEINYPAAPKPAVRGRKTKEAGVPHTPPQIPPKGGEGE